MLAMLGCLVTNLVQESTSSTYSGRRACASFSRSHGAEALIELLFRIFIIRYLMPSFMGDIGQILTKVCHILLRLDALIHKFDLHKPHSEAGNRAPSKRKGKWSIQKQLLRR
jgi:hypothetical protein